MDPGVLAVALDAFAPGRVLAAPSQHVVEALQAHGRDARLIELEGTADAALDALLLAADELSRAGDHAEGLVAEAGRILRPGGELLVSARNPLLLADETLRGFTSAALRAALGHRGFTVDLVTAPGAAARVTDGQLGYAPALDRMPGLLDAAPRVVAVARAPRSAAARSATFFATLPLKIVAAAVVCRDGDGRLLVVHDAFKRHWTIPGGVVDADEDPLTGAAREAREEAGVDVRVGPLLGVFAGTWPDRVLFLYAASPSGPPVEPRPLHTHEVDAATWLPMDQAMRRINPRTRWQITRCLEQPGGTWRI